MAVSKELMMQDPLVQQTLASLRQGYDAIDPARRQFTNSFESFFDEKYIEEQTKFLASVDCLTPVSLSILLAKNFEGFLALHNLTPPLPKDVLDALVKMQDLDDGDFQKIMSRRDPLVIAIVLGEFLAEFTSSDGALEELRHASPQELSMALGGISSMMIVPVLEAMTEAKAWEFMPEKFLNKYIEVTETVADMMTSKTQKKLLLLSIDEFKQEISKKAAEQNEADRQAAATPDSVYDKIRPATKFKLKP